ncbi:regucalcin-like [Belonocnema kinseyi]|uniref:regucalcin-like n=1 Tax=Belonocnema kinseyi TaxID=2817044 RepID=UPI00143DB457|nr:regucalcin-like [Belonocnema kinseyi]
MFVVGAGKEILLVHWDSRQENRNPKWKAIAIVDEHIPHNILDYGSVDPLGRLVFGTTNLEGLKIGNITSLNRLAQFATHIQAVSSTSGFVWDIHATNPPKFYLVDAARNYGVYTTGFHIKLGRFSDNGGLTLTWPKQGWTGSPRRLTVDREGNLWVPLFEGGGVIQVDPRINDILRFIPIPAQRVNACTFGGPKFDILYVSTMWYGHVNEHGQRQRFDEGGSIYAVKGLGVKGWPPGQYKLLVENMITEKFEPVSVRLP